MAVCLSRTVVDLHFDVVIADLEDHEAIAEYDYQGRSDKELSFRKGDVLMLFNRVSCDWWNGELMGQRGLIPDKYIQPTRRRSLSFFILSYFF